VLQLSGICPKAVLERAGVPVLADMPAVGEHLQDDLAVHLNYLAGERDRHRWLRAIETARNLLAQPAFQELDAGEVLPGPGVVEPDDVMRWVAHADRPEAADAATLAWSNARSPSTPRTKPAVVVRVGMEMPGT
jgi:hypothetical protein